MNLQSTTTAPHCPPASKPAPDLGSGDQDDGDGHRFLQRLRAGVSAHPSDRLYPAWAGIALACSGGLLGWCSDDGDAPDPASMLTLALTERLRG